MCFRLDVCPLVSGEIDVIMGFLTSIQSTRFPPDGSLSAIDDQLCGIILHVYSKHNIFSSIAQAYFFKDSIFKSRIVLQKYYHTRQYLSSLERVGSQVGVTAPRGHGSSRHRTSRQLGSVPAARLCACPCFPQSTTPV